VTYEKENPQLTPSSTPHQPRAAGGRAGGSPACGWPAGTGRSNAGTHGPGMAQPGVTRGPSHTLFFLHITEVLPAGHS